MPSATFDSWSMPAGMAMHSPQTARKSSTLAFLARPYVLFLGLFLGTMVAISFDVAVVHDLAMKLRWPMLGLAAAFGLVQVASHGIGRVPPATLCIGLVILIATASAGWSDDPSYSIQRSASLALLFAATMLGVVAYCRKPENVQTIFDLLWWMGAAIVVGGFLFRMGEMGPGNRYVGLHNRATGAGTYAALFLPIAIYQVRYRFEGAWKATGWGVIAAILLQITLSGSRMAMATAALVSLGLWFDFYGRRAMIAVFALVLIAPVPLLLDQREARKFQEKSEQFLRVKTFSTFTGRLDRWVFGLEKFAEKPVAGFGFGLSRTLAGKDEPWRFHLMPGEVYNLHSDQIEVLMDLGLIGYVPFALFWLILLGMGVWIIRRPPTAARQQGLAVFGAVTYAFFDTFMHGGFLAAGGGVAPFSWSMIALFLALAALTRDAAHGPQPPEGAYDKNLATNPARSIRYVASPSSPAITREDLPSVRQILKAGHIERLEHFDKEFRAKHGIST